MVRFNNELDEFESYYQVEEQVYVNTATVTIGDLVMLFSQKRIIISASSRLLYI